MRRDMRTYLPSFSLLSLLGVLSACGGTVGTADTDATPTAPVSTTDTSACGVDALARVNAGYRIQAMAVDEQAIVLTLNSDAGSTVVSSTAGGGFVTLFSSPGEHVASATLDAQQVYGYAQANDGSGTSAILAIPRAGGDASLLFQTQPGHSTGPVASDGQTLFVPSDGSILAVSVQGGVARTVFTGTARVDGAMLDGQSVVWWQQDGTFTSAVQSAPIAGSLAATNLQMPLSGAASAFDVRGGVLAYLLVNPDFTTSLVVQRPGAAPARLDTSAAFVATQGTGPVALAGSTIYYSLDGSTLREVPIDGSRAPVTVSRPVSGGLVHLGVQAKHAVYATPGCVYRAP